MKKNKGFTLIELLAVIVILAIIAIIATPIILNIVNKAKKSAFLDSAYGIMESAKLYYTESMLNGGITEDKTFLFEGDVPEGLNYSGTSPKGGMLVVGTDGKISLSIHNGSYCASKGINDRNITLADYEEGNCIIPDNAKDPVISLNGEKEIRLKQGEIYTEEGATAKTVDGEELSYSTEIKVNETVVTSVETDTVGTIYTITYTVASNNKTASVTRTVMIVDGIAPVIIFAENPVTLKVTEVNSYNIYTGVTVTDNIDGEIEVTMETVKTTGELKAEEGEYIVTYEVTDSSGNKASLDRTFIVVDAEGPILNLSSMNTGNQWVTARSITATINSKYNVQTFTYEIIKDNVSKGIETVTVTGKEGTVDISLNESGLYTIKLTGIDEYGNSSELSSGTYKIDVITPTISLKSTASETIVQGTSNVIQNYFTITSPTTYSGSTTVCRDGTSSTSPVVTSTSSLAVGTHTIRCTVTRGNGKTAYKDKSIVVNAANADTSGAEKPQITNGLVPIKWNGSAWIVADRNNTPGANQWYDYNTQMWANGASVTEEYRNAAVGTIIPEDGVLAYFVWIPRYEYMYTDLGYLQGYAGGTREQPGEIKINFIAKSKTVATSNYKIHPAFHFGGTELSGIWVGKFETNGSSSIPTIKPKLKTLVNQNISTQFATAQRFSYLGGTYGISSSADAHMMKNSEWGAVAYLSQSKYGKYGNSNYLGTAKEVYINNFYDAKYVLPLSGCSSGSPNAENRSVCEYTYEKEGQGTGASTTGTIYGVYDMSGGAKEAVMGVYRGSDAASPWGSATSEGNGAGFTAAPASKYYDEYTGQVITTACGGGICHGHALSETHAWYGDGGGYIDTDIPWLTRGGAFYSMKTAGLFNKDGTLGKASSEISFRVVLLG